MTVTVPTARAQSPSTGTFPSPLRAWRLALLALLFVIQGVTLALVLAAERVHTEELIRQSAAHQMQQLVARTSDSTRRYLAPAARAADFTRLQLEGGVLAVNHDRALEAAFLTLLRSNPELQAAYLARADGSFVFVGRQAGGFHSKFITLGGGRQVRLVERGPAGQLLSTRLDLADRYDPRTRPWYGRAQASGRLIWTDPYVFFTKQVPGLTSAAPVLGAQGLRAVVGVDVALSDLAGFLTGVPISRHGSAFISTLGGSAIAYPGIASRYGAGTRQLPLIHQAGAAAGQLFTDYSRGTKSELDTFVASGVPHYGMAQALDIGQGSRWLIGVHAPASDFNGPVWAQYQRLTFTVLGLGALTFLLALPLLARFQRPLTRLERFGTHFTQSFQINALLSPDGTLLEVNDAALQLARTSRAEVIGRSLDRLPLWPAGGAEQALVRAALQRARQGELVQLEVELGPPGEARRTVDVSFKPLLGRRGELSYLIAEGRDITERRAMERALRASEERLRTVVDALEEGVMVQDVQGRILSLNPSAERILNVRASDVVGRLEGELNWRAVHADGSPFPRNDLPALVALRTGQSQMGAMFGAVLRGGETVWISLSAHLLIRPDETTPYAVVSSFTDITARKRYEDQLAHQALHDGLTGLPNRTLFRERLLGALREGRHGAVAFLDLDGFKTINDTLGHETGDALLAALAERLRQTVRASDTVARMGGDEFTLILTGVETPEVANDLARKVMAAVCAPLTVNGHDLTPSASLGVALYPQDGHDIETLIHSADTAMYEAKRVGKHTHCLFQPHLSDHVLARNLLEAELKRASLRGEFELHYQPLYRLPDFTPSGVEALLRWRHPERGLMAPGEFVPLLEESGLIVPVGTWALFEACREVAALRQRTGQPLKVAVNVSAVQFARGDFARVVEDALRQHDLEPAALELELTESMVMADIEEARARIGQLRHLGVRLAIDDFGTGYSNLSSLHLLPIDILKIDRSFVQNALTDDTLVRTVVGLARHLGLEVVAEGVETAEQLQLLNTLGCDRMQGYYGGRVMPLEDTALHLQRAGHLA